MNSTMNLTGAGQLREKNTKTNLVFFDCDGTLTKHDSLVPYLLRVDGNAALFSFHVGQALFDVVRAGRFSRNAAKQSLLFRCLRGRDVQELRTIGATYAQRMHASKLLPDAFARMVEAQDVATVVLVSASLDLYLEHFVSLLGINDCLCTEVEFDACGRATGRLLGANVRGREKVQRVESWMGERGLNRLECFVTAYGDSKGDRELLAFADRGLLRAKKGLFRTGTFALDHPV
jgi:phosphatidylglycerophosphatase C